MKPEETRVVVVSPFRAGNGRSREYHLTFAKLLCGRLARAGYIVFASHVFCPLFLDEDNEADRTNGLRIERGWIDVSYRLAVWDPWGVSGGMAGAIDYVGELNRDRELRAAGLFEAGFNPGLAPSPILVHYASRGEVPEWNELIASMRERP